MVQDLDSQQPNASDVPDDVLRPTHYLENIKLGNRGIQLLVSTKDHLYKATGVEAGEDSCQIIGAWEGDSIREISHILSQHFATATSQPPESPHFGSYGSGQTLGGAPGGNTAKTGK